MPGLNQIRAGFVPGKAGMINIRGTLAFTEICFGRDAQTPSPGNLGRIKTLHLEGVAAERCAYMLATNRITRWQESTVY